jgi:FG-GAP repeat protein
MLFLSLALASLAQHEFNLTSENHWDGMGMQVFYLDDINGDGVPEFGTGAFCTDYNDVNSGSVYIFDGATQMQLRRHDGLAHQARLGESAIECGDVDGDGFVDYASGARNESNVGNRTGAVYLWSGLTGDLIRTYNGQANNSDFGRGLANIGDINGDGRPDLGIGAPTEANKLGVVRAYSGADGSRLMRLAGLSPGGRFGYFVSGLGDVDGDGIPDFGASAPYANQQTGELFVISGEGDEILQQFEGQVPGSRLGWRFAGVGDTNGDGLLDILVGVPCQDSVYLMTIFSQRIIREYHGNILPDKIGLGHTLVATGDLDGDGFDDYAIGTPGNWDWGTFTYLGPGGGVAVVSGLNGGLIAGFWANEQDDSFGSAIAIYPPNIGTPNHAILLGAPAWGQLTANKAPGMVSGRLLR